MRLLIVGAGGVGGYFGGRLAEAGVDVTFLVRPRRQQQLQNEGLRVVSPIGDIKLRVKTILTTDVTAGYDLVLLTCKAYDLDSAIAAFARAMDGTGCVLPLLNGMAHFDQLDARFGAANVIGGTCALSVTLLDSGIIQHTTRLQRLVFGERGGAPGEHARAFTKVLERTRIDWVLSQDIEQELWEKVVLLSTLAAGTCLLRANVGEILGAEGGTGVIESLLRTSIDVATHEGHPPRDHAIEIARRTLFDPSSSLTASMLRDLERGAPIESDHIVGWMLERARRHSLDDSILSIAYAHLKAYESRRAARRPESG